MASYCDCRHVREDEESHHGDLDETDHVHEDNDDHCSASYTEDCLAMFFPFPLYNVFVFRVFFGLYGVTASSLLYDLRIDLCSKPFLRHVNPF